MLKIDKIEEISVKEYEFQYTTNDGENSSKYRIIKSKEGNGWVLENPDEDITLPEMEELFKILKKLNKK